MYDDGRCCTFPSVHVTVDGTHDPEQMAQHSSTDADLADFIQLPTESGERLRDSSLLVQYGSGSAEAARCLLLLGSDI